MTDERERGLAAKLSAGLVVAALLYVGRTCAVFAAGLLLYGVIEEAWGLLGVLGMASLAGSIACGIASGIALKRDTGSATGVALTAVGATALMFLGAILVAKQLN